VHGIRACIKYSFGFLVFKLLISLTDEVIQGKPEFWWQRAAEFQENIPCPGLIFCIAFHRTEQSLCRWPASR